MMPKRKKKAEWECIVQQRQPKIKQAFLGVFFTVAISFAAVVLIADDGSAGQFYPGGRQRCLNTSGGRASFQSVIYACDKATAKSQNACSAWLGPTNNSATREIYLSAPSLDSTQYIKAWGMCTDRANTTGIGLSIIGDNNSIGYGSATGVDTPPFYRTGNWGNPSDGMTIPLNVAKFVQGATIEGNMYCRRVGVGRSHSDLNSSAGDSSRICISVGGEIPEPEVEPPEILCNRWAPSGFTGADEFHGTTTVEVKIKNLEQRFAGDASGDWGDGVIYAMPTDKIAWVECYYGGTPGTGHTPISSFEGGEKTYAEMSDDWCHITPSGYVWVPPAGFYPSENVGSTPLSVFYYELWTKAAVWENHWRINGNGLALEAGDSPGVGGWWEFDKFTNASDMKLNRYYTKEGEAGQSFYEYATAGDPMAVNISRDNPTATINKSYYETTETDYSSPKTCLSVPNPLYNPLIPGSLPSMSVLVTSGDKCGYNTYQLPHYDGFSCTNKYSGELRDGHIGYGPSEDTAKVLIPYNFETYTGVTVSSDVAYSGETIDVDNVWTSVEAKNNAVTKAAYATQVPGARLKLFAYVTADIDNGNIGGLTTGDDNGCGLIGGAAKQCLEFRSKSGFTLNGGGRLDGSYDEFTDMGGKYNAFDASAGDLMCFVSAVYPASSGSDTQMGTDGDGNWRYSEPSCTIIAKKPSFQVWGDSMYSKGGIETINAAKRYLYNDYYGGSSTNLCKNGNCFNPTSHGPTNYIGSWVEEGLILNTGTTNTFASGAALGYDSSSNFTRAGVSNFNITNISPLTFSNQLSADLSRVGASGLDSAVGDRDDLIKYWIGDNVRGINTSGSINLAYNNSVGESIKSASGVAIRYVHSNSISISGTVPKSTTYLINVDGTVTITGDIKYEDSTYKMLKEIPKVIIYANNINISCNVGEVDAILITKSNDGNLDTCYDGGGDSSSARSRQLKVFGTVMTGKVSLGRTYGAAAWNGSMNGGRTTDAVPAEVFDYDSTIPMWSEYMGGSVETDTMQIVYQHELAPRY